jgi:ubiquinone/menaquinone biosynthesis C-methylase UbiE
MAARRATDAATKAQAAIFRCPRCGAGLRVVGSSLECSRRHRHPEIGGVFDLLPAAGGGFDLFGTPYGRLYDAGIKNRGLARLAGRLLFGMDAGEIFEMMDAAVRCEPGEVVLDLPCGGAPGLRAAPGRMRGTYVGVDLSLPMLAQAARIRREEDLDGVVLIRGDATDLPLQDGSVDRVLCLNGLHVIPDQEAVLRELHRVLKPGGQCWGSAIARRGQGGLLGVLGTLTAGVEPRLLHPVDPAGLKAAARAIGFSTWRQHLSGSMLVFRGRVGGR